MSTFIHHVTKVEFLSSFIKAHNASITPHNIQAGFHGAGLVPFNPESVIEKPDIHLQTPSPTLDQNEPWQSHTPHTVTALASQNQFIKA
jgi:hypothetical protein